MRESDSYWQKKTSELESWIDFHISQGHGPPTHFVTLTCAENWWPDLKTLLAYDEDLTLFSDADRMNKFKSHCKKVREKTLYVNQFFMKRAKLFMDTYARNVLGIEHYWGRVEFASGWGQIHIHLLRITKNKAYLPAFYAAKTEKDKVEVLRRYAMEEMGMTADVDVDDDSDHREFKDIVENSSIHV